MEVSRKQTSANADSVSDEADMTIDQVALHAEIPVSTVRLYQNKGLLPPPERRGRVGFYNGGHRDRLRLIAHLQERGFSLAAIKESLDLWNAGRSLDHLLGVGDVAPTLEREPVRLSLLDLVERFDGVPLTQDDMQRAAALGLIKIDGADIVVSNETFAEIGPAVARLGVPISEILDEYEALQDSVLEIANRFQAVFERRLWQPFVDRRMPPDEVAALATNVGQLTELATSVVTTELHRRFASFAAEYLARVEAENIGMHRAPPQRKHRDAAQ